MSTHQPDCQWERTTAEQCEYRATHRYCPHPEHACTCTPQDEEQNVIVSTVTITRRYYPDRDNSNEQDVVSVEPSEGLTLLDQLGLLEFAKLSTAADLIAGDDDQ